MKHDLKHEGHDITEPKEKAKVLNSYFQCLQKKKKTVNPPQLTYPEEINELGNYQTIEMEVVSKKSKPFEQRMLIINDIPS